MDDLYKPGVTVINNTFHLYSFREHLAGWGYQVINFLCNKRIETKLFEIDGTQYRNMTPDGAIEGYYKICGVNKKEWEEKIPHMDFDYEKYKAQLSVHRYPEQDNKWGWVIKYDKRFPNLKSSILYDSEKDARNSGQQALAYSLKLKNEISLAYAIDDKNAQLSDSNPLVSTIQKRVFIPHEKRLTNKEIGVVEKILDAGSGQDIDLPELKSVLSKLHEIYTNLLLLE